MTPAITIDAVRKSFHGTVVLNDVTAQIVHGALTVIGGPSGSGKTTLLNLISSLDTPDAGSVTVGGVEITGLSRRARDRYRAANGQIFQRSGLLGGLTVRENIESGHTLTGRTLSSTWIQHLVNQLQIGELLEAKASTLSGGQAQRAALVRALAHRPRHLFADEPTASLDTASTHVVYQLLREMAETEGTTVLLVSHDDVSKNYAHHNIRLVDGRIESRSET